jgi:hypothetical protein
MLTMGVFLGCKNRFEARIIISTLKHLPGDFQVPPPKATHGKY